MSGSVRLWIVRRLALLILAIPAIATAQGQPSHWGAAVSFAPSVKSMPFYNNLFISETDDKLDTSEISVGIVRGKARGGHWAVNFVQKPFKDGTTIVEVEEFTDVGFFSRTKQTLVFEKVRMRGIEYVAFLSFVKIKERVLIGMNLGIGVAQVEGNITETLEFFNSFTAPNGQVFEDSQTEVFTSPANETLFKYQILGKVEVAGAVVLAAPLKVQIAGGFNSPGTGMRVSVVYLFGAK
jgi:hypothetical protein